MYAFRKPFLAAQYQELALWDLDYKVILIIAQVLGYTVSKFLGIKVVSEATVQSRLMTIVKLIMAAWLMLLMFGLIPYPYNFIFLFFNGLSLGMIWGLVFSFIEGKHNTELLAAFLSSSFIVSSGAVKSVGVKFLMMGVAEFWMPFLAGLVFLPLLFLGIWLLSKVPGQTANDIKQRTARVPMSGSKRLSFFLNFVPGIICATLIYMSLTGLRDFRDNFAVELWTALGFADTPGILTLSEIPIAVICLVFIGSMIYIRDNRRAFYLNIKLIAVSGLAVLVVTLLFIWGLLGPIAWMVLVGLGTYSAYLIYHTMLFERWIAWYREPANVGYLMYISDAFGYSASVAIILYKDLGNPDISWLGFFTSLAIITGGMVLVGSICLWWYFRHKEAQLGMMATR